MEAWKNLFSRSCSLTLPERSKTRNRSGQKLAIRNTEQKTNRAWNSGSCSCRCPVDLQCLTFTFWNAVSVHTPPRKQSHLIFTFPQIREESGVGHNWLVGAGQKLPTAVSTIEQLHFQQERVLSVKAERPNHPSRSYARQSGGGGQPVGGVGGGGGGRSRRHVHDSIRPIWLTVALGLKTLNSNASTVPNFQHKPNRDKSN